MFHPRMRRLMALLVVLSVCVVLLLIQRRERALRHKANSPSDLITPEMLAQFTAIENRERQLDETVWAKERRAEQCGAVFDALWDELKRATNQFDVLASFPVGELVVAKYGPAQSLVHGVELWQASQGQSVWLQGEWQQFLASTGASGWQL